MVTFILSFPSFPPSDRVAAWHTIVYSALFSVHIQRICVLASVMFRKQSLSLLIGVSLQPVGLTCTRVPLSSALLCVA